MQYIMSNEELKLRIEILDEKIKRLRQTFEKALKTKFFDTATSISVRIVELESERDVLLRHV